MNKINKTTHNTLIGLIIGLCLSTYTIIHISSLYASQKPTQAHSSKTETLPSQIEATYDAIIQNKQLLPTEAAGAQKALKSVENWQNITRQLKIFAEQNSFNNTLLKNTWAQYITVDFELKQALASYYESIRTFGTMQDFIKKSTYQPTLNTLKSHLENNIAAASQKLNILKQKLEKEQFSGFFEKDKARKTATKQLLLGLINKLQAAMVRVTNTVMMTHAQAKQETAKPTPTKTATQTPAKQAATPTKTTTSAQPNATESVTPVADITPTKNQNNNNEQKQVQEAEALKKQLEQDNNNYSDAAWREYKYEHEKGFSMYNDRSFYDSWKRNQQNNLKFAKMDDAKKHLVPVYEEFLAKLEDTQKANSEAANKLKSNLETINAQLKKSAESNKSQVWGNWGNEAQTKYDKWLQTQREKMATALNNKQEHLAKVYKAFFESIKKSS